MTKEKELATVLHLFGEARKYLRETNREIAIVVEYNETWITAAVDSVETVEKPQPADITELTEVIPHLNIDCVGGIGKRTKDSELVQLLDIGNILGTYQLIDVVCSREL